MSDDKKEAPKKPRPVCNAAMRAILTDLITVSHMDNQDKARHLATLTNEGSDNDAD